MKNKPEQLERAVIKAIEETMSKLNGKCTISTRLELNDKLELYVSLLRQSGYELSFIQNENGIFLAYIIDGIRRSMPVNK